jgi:sulfite reductase beta subunit-like hemoprotein
LKHRCYSPDEAIPVLRALLDAWKEDLRYRVSRVNARMKFMVERTIAAIGEIGFPLDASGIRGRSLACTGKPHCNFSVTETKTRLDRLIQHLEGTFGSAIDDLRLHLDGCPHACAQHWVGDIGFQGTTARDAEGKRRLAYDVYLRGALGPQAAIARPLFRRVPTQELDELVAGLVSGWLEQREPDESFRTFCDAQTDEALGELAGWEPAARKEAA